MDWDKDGKLNFQEFRDNAYDIFKSYYHFSFDNDYVPSPELQFSNLDLNKDRYHNFFYHFSTLVCILYYGSVIRHFFVWTYFIWEKKYFV